MGRVTILLFYFGIGLILMVILLLQKSDLFDMQFFSSPFSFFLFLFFLF